MPVMVAASDTTTGRAAPVGETTKCGKCFATKVPRRPCPGCGDEG